MSNCKKTLLSILGALAVIVAISMAFFYPDNIEGNVLSQYDMQQGEGLGHEVVSWQEQTGHKTWWTNSVFGGMPVYQISPSYASTKFFSWIGKVYGLGLPHPADLLAMMMIGMLILLLALKVRPWMALVGAVAWGLSSYFVIIIGAGHLWKFYTLTYVPPTIAGLVMIYNGRRLLGAAVAALAMMMQIASNHVQMSYYFAFVMAGLVIAYGVAALKDKRLGRWGIDTAILAGAMLLAVGANAPTLYHTYEYSKHSMRGGQSELSRTDVADAANVTSGLDRDYITTYSYGRTETLSLLIPNVVGGASAMPVGGQMAGLTLADTPEGRDLMARDGRMTLLQLFSPYYGGAEGTNGPVYVGAIIVALFLFGAIVVKGPVKWALVVLTVLSVLLALGRNLQWFTDLFIDWMPMYSKFRAVESILVIAEFTMPLLAILGLREFFTSTDRRKLVKPLAVSFGICLAICLAGIVAPGMFGSKVLGERDVMTIAQYVNAGALPAGFDMTQYPEVLQVVESMRSSALSSDALRSLAFIAVAGIALLLMARRTVKPAVALAVVGVAVTLDLYTADKRYLNSASFAAPSAAQAFVPSAADRIILQDTDPDFRVLDATKFYTNDAAYFHKTVGGYHAAKLSRYQDMIDRHLAYVARPEAAQLLALRGDSAAMAQFEPDEVRWLNSHLNVLDMLNTRYVIADPSQPPVLNERALGNAWFVNGLTYVDGADAEMAALDTIDPGRYAVADARFRPLLGEPRPSAAANTISLTSYAPDRLEYDADCAEGALAVFSEIYYPAGWTATIDGKPAELGRVDYLLRALPVPAGHHKIVMEFRPASIGRTNAVAYAAVSVVYLLLIAGVIAGVRRRRK